MSKVKTYAKAILIPVIVGVVIGLLISSSIDYNELKKPFLSPPSSVFPVVWTILYILMGISYGILDDNNLINENVSKKYYFQLVVNALWPIFFFLFKWRLFAFFVIVVLDILVYLMLKTFYSKNKTAGLLQIPYLAWSIFATYLNLFVYILNN